MKISTPESDADLHDVRSLVREYNASLDVDLTFQDIEAEIATLPGKFTPPGGALFLARDEHGEAIGCACIRPFDRVGSCEMKRLYVRPSGRGAGAGRALVNACVTFAKKTGYTSILLDSLPAFVEAIRLYRSVGFVEVPPYWNNTLPGILYFEKTLRSGSN